MNIVKKLTCAVEYVCEKGAKMQAMQGD